MYSSTDEQKNEEGDNTQTQIRKDKEKIIPLYEEQFEIVKKMVKVAEIVITKRRVTEKTCLVYLIWLDELITVSIQTS
jgi:stress response protein YsnF